MRHINIIEQVSEKTITPVDLQNIENTKNCILPKEYKNFLLNYNGGKPYWKSFAIGEELIKGELSFDNIRCFYGICSDTGSVMYNYDIFQVIKARHNRIPKNLLPIATDSFGNEICLCIQGSNYRKVYFWDHENEGMDDNEEPWWQNVYLIANSFDEFIDGLFEFDIDDEGNETYKFQDGTVKVIPTKN